MTFERLTALDAAFLDAEKPETPIHLGALSRFEGGPLLDGSGHLRLEELQALVASRLDQMPRFRQKLMLVPLGIGRPVWIDDPDFDVSHHVRVVSLTPPGDRAQLFRLCEDVHLRLLDRRRPLWEVWFVEGLADGSVGLIEKVHHSMVDGVSGVDFAAMLLDVEPIPSVPTPDVQPTRPWRPARGPTGVELLAASVRDLVTEPATLARGARHAMVTPVRTMRRMVELGDAALSFVLPHPFAPRTSLNAPVGSHHRLAAVRIPLADAKATTTALGGTVNDLVLAAVTSGLRALLARRGALRDDEELRVLVPVSIRAADEHGALGNKVAGMVAPLPVGVPDAMERLLLIQRATRDLKHHHQAELSTTALGWADLLPPRVAARMVRVVDHQPFINAVVTNIPGPDFPLYLMGARMLEAIPIVPLAGNLAVGVAVLSYDGQLVLGVHVDADTVADLDELTDAIDASLRTYADFAGVPRAG